MKPVPFVPVVREVSPEAAGRTPGLESAISYWNEEALSAEEWLREVGENWGNAALSMQRGDEQLGFALYGPREYLPRSERYLEPAPEEEIILAYVGGDERTRRHLLARVLKELRSHKVEEARAVACDVRRPWHVPTRFLLESGWSPVRRVWRGGRPYTILRVDLKNAVEVGGLARGLIGRVKLPSLGRPRPAPGAFTREAPDARLTVVGSRS